MLTTASSLTGHLRRCETIVLVVYQVVGFFDVAARLCAGDGPIAALVGGST